MKHHLRATIVTLVAAFGFLAREITDSAWRFLIYALSALAVYALNVWELKPDTRVERIRQAHLKDLFDGFFRNVWGRVKKGQRLPFRANIMVPRYSLVRPRLEMVYAYEMRKTDPDYGFVWWFPRGLCWRVFRTGQREWYDQATGKAGAFHLTTVEVKATENVKALICLPVRSAHKEARGLRRGVDAVLNIDALTDEAAAALRAEWDRLMADENPEIVDLLKAISLYF